MNIKKIKDWIKSQPIIVTDENICSLISVMKFKDVPKRETSFSKTITIKKNK